MRHISRMPIRFSDVDMFRRLNHTRYLTFCEDNRAELLRLMDQQCGTSVMTDGVVLAHVSIDYLRSLTLDDGEAEVHGWILGIGRSSVRIRHEICTTARPATVAVATVVLVPVGPSGRSRPLVDREREFFTRYLEPEIESISV